MINTQLETLTTFSFFYAFGCLRSQKLLGSTCTWLPSEEAQLSHRHVCFQGFHQDSVCVKQVSAHTMILLFFFVCK